MSRLKKITGQNLVIAVLSILLVASVIFNFTGAWFTDSYLDDTHSIKFGTLDLTNESVVAISSGGDTQNMMPGSTLTISVNYDVIGDPNGSWIRIKVDIDDGGRSQDVSLTSADPDYIKMGAGSASEGYIFKQTKLPEDTDGAATTETVDFTMAFTGRDFDNEYQDAVITYRVEIAALQGSYINTLNDAITEFEYIGAAVPAI